MSELTREQELESGELEPRKRCQIMNFKEYAKVEHDNPYVFEVEFGDKKLVYFGSAHSQNPSDEMFLKIEEKFQETNP